MASKLTPVQAEEARLYAEALELTNRPDFTRRDEARVSVLLAQIKSLREGGVDVAAAEKRWFRGFFKGETRNDFEAGTQTPTYTQGAAGGFLVPQEFENSIVLGMSQNDPLLDENIVTLIRSKRYSARPLSVPGWDLSTFAAVRKTEATQQAVQTVPPTTRILLNGYQYSASLDGSLEFEEDDFEPTIDQMKVAFGVGFARGIGIDLITGSGSSQPQGVLTGAANSGVTLDPTIAADVSTTLNDKFQAAYFSINRIYRAAPKCGWVMNDTTYQWIRSLTDKQARPLLSIKNDKEVLMGKPVYISPTMPVYANTSPVTVGKIIFGDLSHYFVRVSNIALQRLTQAPGYIEFGKALFTARMRADAAVHDPTGGVTPPIVYINVHP